MDALPSLFQLVSRLVAASSVSSTQADRDQNNEPVIGLLDHWFARLGFETVVMPVPANPGKFNLLARMGSGSGGLVLSGHTDTVPCDPERWSGDPLKVVERQGRLYGLGTCDMKGFFAAVIETVRDLPLKRLQQPLYVLATADEESTMSGMRAIAEGNALQPRWGVIGEPTSLVPVHMHKGILMEALTITGQAGHSSDPDLGINAIELMHEALESLQRFRHDLQQAYRNEAFAVPVPTLNFGALHGGDNPNRICGQCCLQFDLRPLPGMDIDVLHRQLNATLSAVLQGTGSRFELAKLFGGVPPFASKPESTLVPLCESLTGHPARSVSFATEAPFLQRLGADVVILGPGSIDQAHQPDEYIDIGQLQTSIGLYRQLIRHCCIESGRGL